MKVNSFNYNTLLFFIVRCLFIGICFTNLIAISKLDSCISIIIASLISVLPLLLYNYISNKYEDLNIYEIINNNYISLILSIFVFFFSSFIYFNIINLISSQFLYKTPDILISLIFIISIIYANYKGLNTILRISTILFYITFLIIITSFFSLIYESDITNLMPVLNNGLEGVFKGSFHFITLNTLPLFLLLVIPKNYISRSFKSNLIMNFISIFTLLIICFLVLTIYGVDLAKLFHYPEFHIFKRIALMGFIKRLENIFALQWMFDYFIFISFSIYFICQNPIIKKVKYNFIIVPLLLVFTTNIIFKSNTQASLFYLNVLPYLSFVFFLVLPIFLSIKKDTNPI